MMSPRNIPYVLFACIVVSSSQAVAEEAGYELDWKAFKIGMTWVRYAQLNYVNRSQQYDAPKESMVKFKVIEGADERGDGARIVIEADFEAFAGRENNPVRYIFNYSGQFCGFQLKRGDKWIDEMKTTEELKKRATIFVVDKVYMHYLCLPLPLRWEDSIQEFSTNIDRQAVLIKTVKGNELKVVCAIRAQKGKLGTENLPPDSCGLYRLFTATYKKGIPWAVSLECNNSFEFSLSLSPSPVQKP